MQRLLFVAFVLVAGTVFGQYSPLPVGQPILQQPLQTPPKSMTLNGVPVQPNAQPDNRTLPPGYGSPYPTGQPGAVTTPQPGGVYGIPPQPGPPIRVAQANPAVASTAPGVVVGPDGRQYLHVGRAEPEFQVVPFVLTPVEQQELDEFLDRWEQFSSTIKTFEVGFTCYEYEPAVKEDGPLHTTYGYFKYTSPRRFVFHVEGQWVNGKQVKNGSKEEKTIIDGNTVYEYDFKEKAVNQHNIDPELMARGFADSPLPLIFGARADEMKRRFSMKIVTANDYKDSQVWLAVKPLLIADQTEFRALEIRIDKKTLRATALKKEEVLNGTHKVYVLSDHKINTPFASIIQFFKPDVPPGMTLVVVDTPLPQPDSGQPKNANPFPNVMPTNPAPPNPGNEIKLY